MQLTRRDAVAALSALGGASLAGCAAPTDSEARDGTGEPSDVDAERIRETLIAAAGVVYPDAVSGIPAFVEAFLDGRLANDAHARGLDETVAEVNDLAESWYGDAFPELPEAERDSLLREVGAATAAEVPDGRTAERVRYYVVNELLLALYTSPTGGELVGIENPRGHPGGIESYQRGSQS